MKPVLQKVAANIYEDKLKPYYEEEIKPHTNTLSGTGVAAGAGIGATLGYLTNKYLFNNDGPVSSVLSTVAGALAGASLYTANEIWAEKRRKEISAKLPPGKRMLEDGTTVDEVVEENTPWYAGPRTRAILTGGAGVGGGVLGYKLGHKAYDAIANRLTWTQRGANRPNFAGFHLHNQVKKAQKEVDSLYDRLQKVKGANTIARIENEIRQKEGLIQRYSNRAGRSITRRWMGRIGSPVAAALAAYGMWKLTDPGSREQISKVLDKE